MSKQLDNMWTSKWVLPEHREALEEDTRKLRRVPRPALDEQAITECFRILEESWKTGIAVRLSVYDSGQVIEVSGLVDQMDPFRQRLRLIHDYKRTWVDFIDVLSAAEL
jgi:hypothetical protein